MAQADDNPKPSKTRTAIAALVLSAAGLVGIVHWEGYSSTAYIPVPGDVPTIGFGTTAGVKAGDTITPQAALTRALADVSKFEGALKQCVTVPLSQGEYDSLVSFSYNVGTAAFCGSTLVKLLNRGQYTAACAELSKWVYQGGRVLHGLVKRREAERAKCEGRA